MYSGIQNASEYFTCRSRLYIDTIRHQQQEVKCTLLITLLYCCFFLLQHTDFKTFHHRVV